MTRTLHRLLLATLLLVSGSFAVAHAADAESYAEGRHYARVPGPSLPDPKLDPKKITVEEFFWYGCPHCYRLEPLLKDWRKKLPADAVFVRVPNSLGRPDGELHERAFYTAELLGIEERIHQPIMDALVRDHMPLVTPDAIRDFFVNGQKVSAKDYDGAVNSFMVDSAMRRADELSVNYRITGVPTIVVGGRYTTEIGAPGIMDARLSEAELYAKMLKVVDFLVAKVRDENKEAPAATKK